MTGMCMGISVARREYRALSVTPSLADENAEPFTLYHYNGLDGKANSSHLSEIRLYRRLVTIFIHVSAHHQTTYSTRSKCGGTDTFLVYTNPYYTLSMQRTALNCIGVASVPLSGEGVGGIGRVPLEEVCRCHVTTCSSYASRPGPP